jgi:hypothetical protein
LEIDEGVVNTLGKWLMQLL